jgi:hypothetical protein
MKLPIALSIVALAVSIVSLAVTLSVGNPGHGSTAAKSAAVKAQSRCLPLHNAIGYFVVGYGPEAC